MRRPHQMRAVVAPLTPLRACAPLPGNRAKRMLLAPHRGVPLHSLLPDKQTTARVRAHARTPARRPPAPGGARRGRAVVRACRRQKDSSRGLELRNLSRPRAGAPVLGRREAAAAGCGARVATAPQRRAPPELRAQPTRSVRYRTCKCEHQQWGTPNLAARPSGEAPSCGPHCPAAAGKLCHRHPGSAATTVA